MADPDKNITLDEETAAVLRELGRAQTAYKEYGAAGRTDLQANAHTYAEQLRADAQKKGIDLSRYGTENQWGRNYEQYWTGGTAGNYDPSKPGLVTTQSQSAPVSQSGGQIAGPVTPTGASQPTTNPLPSSTSLGQQASAAGRANPLNWGAIRSRARTDANLQVEMLRQQAQQNFGRFQSEGTSQVDKLRAMYAPQYRQNELNTMAAARSAVQGAANRGFFASGLSQNADEQARLEGERQRMAMQGQENAQVGEIENRINLARQELGDTLQNLSGREAQLIQSLINQYGTDERNYDLQNRQLSADVALRLMGLDQNFNQFNQSLSWDQSKFGQQLNQSNSQFDRTMQFNQEGRQLEYGDRAAQRAWQTGENTAQRTWTGTENQKNRDFQISESALDRQNRIDLANLDAKTRMELQTAAQSWQAGQASLDRADSRSRWMIETGLRAMWQSQENQFKQDQFQWQKDESQADRTLRTNAANSQWMAFADQALQSGTWKSLDDAVRALNSHSGRIISDGASMDQLYSYVKKRLGGGSSGEPSMSWYVDPSK